MSEENPSSDIPKTTEGDGEKLEVPADVHSSEPGSSSEQESLSTPQTSSSLSGTVHSSSQTSSSETKTSEEEPSARAPSSSSQEPTVLPATEVPSSPVRSPEPAAPAEPGPISPGREVRVRKRGHSIRRLWKNIEDVVKGLSLKPKKSRRAEASPAGDTAGPSTVTTPAGDTAGPSTVTTPAEEAAGTEPLAEPLAWGEGRLSLDLGVDDEMTEVTSVSGCSTNVFLPDPVERKESVSSCDTGAHVSRLPSETEPIKNTSEDKRSPSKTTEDEE